METQTRQNVETRHILGFGLVPLFNGMSTFMDYLMRKPSLSFGLVWFYGISTIVSYLISNPLFTHILNI